MSAQTPRPIVFPHDPPAQAAWEGYLSEARRRGLAPATLGHRSELLGRYARWLSPTPVLDATVWQVEAWAQSLTGLAPRSQNLYLRHLEAYYRWCARRGWIATDPTVDLIKPRIRPGLPHPINHADLTMALAAAGQPLRAWLVLAAFCGLRAGEIAHLRREHVLDDRSLLHVVNGKGGRDRLVPLSTAVFTELGCHLTGRRGRLWLANYSNAPNRLSRDVGEHLRSLGIAHTCHSLRHYFGTEVYRRSRDLRLTQDMLGHASPAMSAIYAAWDPTRAGPVLDDLAVDGLQHGGAAS
ncbi:MAG: tyrosine-type recombinase/integrase [Pseudonocardiaceae bacterium]|nr:tyrosine-type recombinase/integrase [Pseudonocardiaceae bacterium]